MFNLRVRSLQLHQLLSSRRAATATATIDSHSLLRFAQAQAELLRELGGRLLLEVIGIEIYEQGISNMTFLIFLFRAHVSAAHCSAALRNGASLSMRGVSPLTVTAILGRSAVSCSLVVIRSIDNV